MNNPTYPSQPDSYVNYPIQQHYTSNPVGDLTNFDPYPDTNLDLDELLESDSTPSWGRRLRPTSTSKSSSTDSGTECDMFPGRSNVDEIDSRSSVDFESDFRVNEVISEDDEIIQDFISDLLRGAPIPPTLLNPEQERPASVLNFNNRISSDGSVISPKPTTALLGPSTLWVPENEAPRREENPTNMANMFAIVFLIIVVVIIRFFYL